MISCSLRYHAPTTLDEAVSLLAEHGADAAVLGGGTMLVPRLGRGESRCAALIDPIALGIDQISAGEREVTIGARTTYRQIVDSALLGQRVPLLVRVATQITGGAQVRNVATVGGSACYANPASDMPGLLVGLGARMTIAGAEGSRDVPAATFFRGAFRTAVAPGELLVSITIPNTPGAAGYHKLKLCEGSWPIVTATAVANEPGETTITFGGLFERPVSVPAGEDLPARLAELDLKPYDDELAPGDYKQAVAPAIAVKAQAAMSTRRSD